MMTIRDLSCRLKVSECSVRRWIEAGQLRVHYLGALIREAGLTQNNKSHLRFFDDPDIVDRFLNLPRRLWAGLPPSRSSRTASKAQAALAVTILTYAPLRIANLAGLAFNETLSFGNKDDQESLIELPAQAMKTREAVSLFLSPSITRRLRTYRHDIMARLSAARRNTSSTMAPASRSALDRFRI